MSRGIVRSLYLVEAPLGAPLITQTVPLVYYTGPYPTSPLTDAAAGPFVVDVGVYLFNPSNATPVTGATLTLEGSWGGGPTAPVALPPLAPGQTTRVNASLTVPAGAVQLWWTVDTAPLARRGLPQPLYGVTATVSAGAAVVRDSRSVGFRVFTLVTGNDTM